MLRIQGTPMAIKHTFNLFCVSALSLTLFSGCAIFNLPKQDNPLNKDENEKYFSSVDMAERFGILEYIQYKGTSLINAMARAGWSVRVYDRDNGFGGVPLDVIFHKNRDMRRITPGARYDWQRVKNKEQYHVSDEEGNRTPEQRDAYFTLDWYERESNLTNWLDGWNVNIESTLKHQFEELRGLYIDYQYITRMETRYINNNKNKLDRSPYYESIYLYPDKYRDIFYQPPVDPKHPKTSNIKDWYSSLSAYGDYLDNLNDRLWYDLKFNLMMLEGTEEEKDKFRKGRLSEPFVSEGYYDL